MIENDKNLGLELLDKRYQALDSQLENEYITQEMYLEHLDKLNAILEQFVLNLKIPAKEKSPFSP